MPSIGSIEIRLTDAGKKALKKAYLEACHEVAEHTYSEAAVNLTEKRWGDSSSIITDTGELLSSEELKKTQNGATLVFNAEHASHVEYGIPVGTYVPITVLARWAGRKLGLSEKEALSAAYAIQTKIANEGTDPRPFLREAVYTVVHEYDKKKVDV